MCGRICSWLITHRRIFIVAVLICILNGHVIYNIFIKHYSNISTEDGRRAPIVSSWIWNNIWSSEDDHGGITVDLHSVDTIFGHAGKTSSHFFLEDYDDGNTRENFTAKVAIGLGITSAGVIDSSEDAIAKNFQFFHTFLPSFCKTASAGYQYDLYLGFDYNDKMFSKISFLKAYQKAFKETANATCPKEIRPTIHLVECNHTKKPTWAQNDAMLEAYLDNADYYYRINDDTLMETPGWTEQFLYTLKKYNPPNFGVVGPQHSGGSLTILTYDFVHKTHIDLFGYYYPRLYSDWWGDNWISDVYGPQRTTKLPSVRLTHTLGLGQRYGVDWSVGDKAAAQLKKDQETINRYLRSLNDTFDRNSSQVPDGTKIISMSLYGKDLVYTWGAIRNAQLIPVYFPGWRLRVYISDDHIAANQSSGEIQNTSLIVPPRILRKLRQLGAEIAVVRTSSETTITSSAAIPPRHWRYLVVDDPEVEYFLIRDADSRLSDRDAFVVNEWLKGQMKQNGGWVRDGAENIDTEEEINPTSGRKTVVAALHCIRDHPKHSTKGMVDGLWGGHAPSIRAAFHAEDGSTLTATLKHIYSKINNYSADISSRNSSQGNNKLLDFTESTLWPLLVSQSFCHDSTSCEPIIWSSVNTRPIRTAREPPTEYLGQKYDEHHELTSKDGKILERFVGKKCSSKTEAVVH